MRKLRLGSVLSSIDGFIAPVDCGAMISSDRFAELERIIAAAVQEGAHLEVGGSRWKHAYLEEGSYFAPTIVGDVQQGMEIAQKECAYSSDLIKSSASYSALVFAPVALIMQYEEIDDAIELANGTHYGLGASVFGPDQEECVKVAKRLECGMVSVNDFGIFYVNFFLSFKSFLNFANFACS